MPSPRMEVPKVAVVTPFVVLKLPVPMELPPSRKVTVPLGKATAVVPGLTTLTVAVKVTCVPCWAGLPELVNLVVVCAALTVCPPDKVPLLVAKLLLPR